MPSRVHLVASLLVLLAGPALAIQRSETVAIGPAPQGLHVDAKTGKLFVATATGIVVLERNGKVTALAQEASAQARASIAGTTGKATAQAGPNGIHYTIDRANSLLLAFDPATGTVTTTELESTPGAL